MDLNESGVEGGERVVEGTHVFASGKDEVTPRCGGGFTGRVGCELSVGEGYG